MHMHVRGIGANTFQAPTPVTCPPGYHDDGSGAAPIRGLGACVPNKVVTLRLRSAPAPAAPSPPPVMAPPPALAPPVYTPPPMPPPAVYAPPSGGGGGDFATAPTPDVCPKLWSWWWLVVAAGVGGVLGHMAQKDKKKAKKNVAALVNGAASRIVNSGAARLFR